MKWIRQHIIISSAALVLCIVALFIWAPWRPSTSGDSSQSPAFQALLPHNTSIEKLGGWQKLTPPDSAPAYVFIDSIDGVGISVSQQELPASLKDNNGAKVAEVAKSYNATKTIYADSTKVYIGTNADGPQSVIFTKNNLLVLIKSRAVIQDQSWVAYINSLK